MDFNEKKSLYESIMNDVAKIVKRRLNESVDDDMKSIYKDVKAGNRSKSELILLAAAKLFGDAIDGTKKINKPVAVDRIQKILNLITKEGREKEFIEDLKKVFAEL